VGDRSDAEAPAAQGRPQSLSSEIFVGLGGRDRKVGAGAERARLMVTKRIKAVLQTIGKLHPPLAHHLRACVKTGYYCSYTPPPAQRVQWTF